MMALERTIRNPNHPNTEHENVQYLNGFGIQMLGIRAPAVIHMTKMFDNLNSVRSCKVMVYIAFFIHCRFNSMSEACEYF